MRYDNDRPGQDQDPVDLTPLWPDRGHPDRWASLVARIETAAAPELARRAGRLTRSAAESLVDGVVAIVARFAAPAFVAAAAAVAIALASARQSEPTEAAGGSAPIVAAADGGEGATESPATESLSEQTIRQALGAEPVGWLGSRDAASADELVRALYAGSGQE
jgi:hypothetical protein